MHGQAPAILIESFQNPINSQHNYNLRNSDFKFYLPEPKTEYMKKRIVVQNFGKTYHPKLEILFR
jgi:hypothetical protein